MTFYSGLATTAKRMLASKGEAITFTRTITGTFDPVTGTATGDTTLSFTANGFAESFSLGLVNGSSILRSDKKVLLESTNKPMIDDVATLSDGTMTVINVEALGLTNDVAAYVLQLRS
jgi:hypothetical protein